MALFACKVGGAEGGGSIVRDLLTPTSTSGQTRTYSLTSYAGYQNFNNNNFMYVMTNSRTTGTINDQSNNRNLSTSFTTPSLSYDASTGELTFTTGNQTKSLDSGKISLGTNNAFDVYLIRVE